MLGGRWAQRRLLWLIVLFGSAAGQEVIPDKQSHLLPFSTAHLVRNLSVAVSNPLELLLQWNQAVDTEGLSYYVLNILHVAADGTAEEYENVLNASLTRIYLKDQWKDEQERTVKLAAGMKLAFRMRAVYRKGTTKILAGRVRAAPAYIVVLDKAGPSRMLRPCEWANDTGACTAFSYSCAVHPIAALPPANQTGNCSSLNNYAPHCIYVQPYSASFSWSAPIDVVSGTEYDVVRYHLQLYVQDQTSGANNRIREVSIFPSSSITAVRFTQLEAFEGRLMALRVRAETRFENEAGSVNGSWSNISSAVLVPGVLLPPDVSADSGKGATGHGYLNLDVRIAPNTSYPPYLPLLRFNLQVSKTPDFQVSCVQQLGTPLQPFLIGNTSLVTRFYSLTVGHTYYIRAQALSYTGPGNFSQHVGKTAVIPPSVPRNLAFQCVAALAFNVTWLVPDNIGCGVGSTCSQILETEEHQSSLMYHLALLPIVSGAGSAPQLDEMSDFAIATRETAHTFDNLTKGRRYWVYARLV